MDPYRLRLLLSHDGCGNTTAKQAASGTTYLQYNTENLLTRIDFAGDGHSYYTYDGDSKRVSQRTADGYTGFVYQGPDMLALQLERNEAGTTQAHYTIGSGLESVRRSTTSHFYHYNHLGTTIALTASNQTVSDTYEHDAWGVLLSSTGSTVNPHTYVGRERYYRMANADLYHLGFRDYNQALGRFVTVDPARLGPNWFSYAGAQVTVDADPLGLAAAPFVSTSWWLASGLGRLPYPPPDLPDLRDLPDWLLRLVATRIAEWLFSCLTRAGQALVREVVERVERYTRLRAMVSAYLADLITKVCERAGLRDVTSEIDPCLVGAIGEFLRRQDSAT